MKKRGMALLLSALLCLIVCCALADDDWGKAVVDAPSGKLHLREEPTSDSDSLGLYFTGTQVTCESDPDEDWVEVKIGRERGYMKSKYLKTGSRADRVTPRFLQGTVDVTNWVRLRKGPSTEYQFICKINDGEDVTVMGETDEHWYYVKYGKETGFISKNLVYVRGEIDSSDAYEYDDAPQTVVSQSVTWRSAYRNWLLQNAGENCRYSLIYVNDDEIPELAIYTGYEAGGCSILTYANGKVEVLQMMRLNFSYIKRGNLLCNSDGHMDMYVDRIFEIRDGYWQCIAHGIGMGYQGGYSETLGRYICEKYTWNGNAVSIAEYLNALSEAYPSQLAQTPSFEYDSADIMTLLGE